MSRPYLQNSRSCRVLSVRGDIQKVKAVEDEQQCALYYDAPSMPAHNGILFAILLRQLLSAPHIYQIEGNVYQENSP